MCGITGILNLNGNSVDNDVLTRMTDTLRHRGPDGQGVWTDGPIGFGHTRLAIIDLSDDGKQPMTTADGRYVITYNGEVYNYVELRDELEQLGCRFHSQSDTEVVLNAFVHWGKGCLNRFNGMWAFAIWDKQEKTLFCARDHSGIKPFYYFRNSECFAFASEAKALLKHPEISATPNDRVIYDYLLFGLVDHREETFFDGIKQLPAGHCLTLAHGNVSIERWWDLDPMRTFDGDDQEKQDALRNCFEDALRLRLRSDVPVGSLLSGGLDSSAIACTVSQLLGSTDGNHRTITAVYDDASVDESGFARETADMAKVDAHFEKLDSDSFWGDLQNLVYHQDFPFQSTSMYAQWGVMQAVQRNGLKVVMDGQGADECLAGYDIYSGSHMFSYLKRGKLLSASRSYGESKAFGRPSFMGQLAQAGHTWGYKHAFLPKIYSLTGQPSWRMLNSSFKNAHSYEPYWHDHYGDFLKDHLYQMFFHSNLPGLLRFEDRNSMAFGVESRPAFLDHRFIELCFSFITDDYIRGGWTKYQFREAMKGRVPESVRTRRDKMGFPTPERRWYSEKSADITDILTSATLKDRGYLDTDVLTNMFSAYLGGKPLRKFPLWRAINLELWFRQFID